MENKNINDILRNNILHEVSIVQNRLNDISVMRENYLNELLNLSKKDPEHKKKLTLYKNLTTESLFLKSYLDGIEWTIKTIKDELEKEIF